MQIACEMYNYLCEMTDTDPFVQLDIMVKQL